MDQLAVKLSKDDVERACLHRFTEHFQGIELTAPLLREVFRTAIEIKHGTPGMTIPVWNGLVVCDPSSPDPYVWANGAVAVNSWRRPDYRAEEIEAGDYGLAGEFFDAVFTREPEKERFLDWLAWCLQHEGDKPSWAPFLYSSTKGSGKSTLCELVASLFGRRNSVTQNGVEKLTGRFNNTVLTSKLVICEELNLRPDSPQSNALKTFITEKEAMAERKGQEATSVSQCCCFIFTSNHLPLWIEPEDRRYYLIEFDHDGHATGPNSKDFAALVGRIKDFMTDEVAVARLHRALLDRELSTGFNAKTLNVIDDATPLMKLVRGASKQTSRDLLRERLAELGLHAVPEQDVAKIVREDLGQNLNSTKHLMTELKWRKSKVKWDGCAYSRALWIEDGNHVDRGLLYGPEGEEQPLARHLRQLTEIDPSREFTAISGGAA